MFVYSGASGGWSSRGSLSAGERNWSSRKGQIVAELRVLHVDDDPSITRIVAERLSAAGYSVTSLNDPSQALDKVVSENFRVVILDIQMAGYDGLQLLERVKKHDGGIQVVMLTGIVTTMVALESMRLGANDCIFKPLTDGEGLTAAVRDAFDRIDRWQNRLKYLGELRKAEQPGCLAT